MGELCPVLQAISICSYLEGPPEVWCPGGFCSLGQQLLVSSRQLFKRTPQLPCHQSQEGVDNRSCFGNWKELGSSRHTEPVSVIQF